LHSPTTCKATLTPHWPIWK